MFPPDLIEPCVKAGTSERGACSECGAPWKRAVEHRAATPKRSGDWKATGKAHRNDIDRKGGFYDASNETTGWQPTCDCDADTVRCLILDPFMGSGTTALVAYGLGRDYLGIELNPDYVEMANERLRELPMRLML